MLLIITVIILLTYTVVLLMFFMGWCALLPKIAHPRPEVVPFSVVKSPRRNSVFISFESITSTSIQSLEYLHQKLSYSSSSMSPSSKQQQKSQRHKSPSNGPASMTERATRENSEICDEVSVQAEKKARSASTPDSGVSNASSLPASKGGVGSSELTALLDSTTVASGITKSVSAQSDYLHPKYSLPPIKIDIADHLLADQHLLRTPVRLKCRPMKTRSRSFDDRNDALTKNNARQTSPFSNWQHHMPLANLSRLTTMTTGTERSCQLRCQQQPKSSSTCLLSEMRQPACTYRQATQQQRQQLLDANSSSATVDGSFIV